MKDLSQWTTVSDRDMWSSWDTILLNTSWKYLDFYRKNNVFYTIFKVRSGLTKVTIASEKYYSISSFNNRNLVYHARLRRNMLLKTDRWFQLCIQLKYSFYNMSVLCLAYHLLSQLWALQLKIYAAGFHFTGKHRLWWMSPWTTNRLVYPIVFSWKHYKLSRCLHLQCKNQMFWYPNCFINWKSYRRLAKQFSSLLMGDYSENSKINTQKHKTRKQFPLGVNNGSRASWRNQCAAWVSGLQSVESLSGEGQKIFL